MLNNNLLCFGIGLVQYRLNFHVNLLGGSFATIPLKGTICSGQKSSILSLSTAHETNALAHAEQADHLTSQSGRVFEIVFRAGCHFVKDDLLSRTASEHP